MSSIERTVETSERKPAAFFRVEGVLVSRPTLAAAAYLASNAQGLGERLTRLGHLALAAPFTAVGELQAGSTAIRATWMAVRGLSEDRIVVLAEEYRARFLEPSVQKIGEDLVARAKKRGETVVFISDHLELFVRPLAERLGADHLLSNRLEILRGRATGRLLDPVAGGNLSGQWGRRFAAEHGLDLERSSAYGARAADGLLLSAIGRPCAVNPDRQLRFMARDHDWPIVDS